jgi:hypothetical protein
MPDDRINRACPFCGETEHLSISEGGIPRPIVAGNDTVKDAAGADEFEEVDGVFCEVCCASAPLDVWNREVAAEVFAILRDFDPPTVRDLGLDCRAEAAA